MKMNKNTLIGLFLISAMIIMSMAVSSTGLTILTAAEATEMTKLKNTSIDYTPYREIVVNEPGVIYKIEITNAGTKEKTYEIIPDASVIRDIGTYRIEPSDTITLKQDEQETVYFYLSIEKAATGRIVIPVKIKSGSTEANIELVARPIGPLQQKTAEKDTYVMTAVFKTVLAIILVIIIIIALILAFNRIKKRKDEEEGEEPETKLDEEIETYY
jgi:flagellar basal body-associated protein FliL